MVKLIVSLFFLSAIALADPIELPWQQELSNTSSGFSDQEAAGKVHYYLQKDVKEWEGLCKIAEGKFHLEYSKIQCQKFYTDWWECTGTVTVFCD